MRHGLRNKVVGSLLLLAALTCLLFGGLGLAFAYVVEDMFFGRMVDEEVGRQKEAWRATGRLAPPALGFMTVHVGLVGLPPDLAPQMAARPRGTEFAGDGGRHYHVRAFVLPGTSTTAIAVAEVGGVLVVRPVRAGIIQVVAYASAGAILLAGLLGWLLARMATAPLTRLAGLVTAADPGHLPLGFSAGIRDDEVGVLARALDAALGRIHAFVEREQHFTADVGHELRTPLAIIRSSAELMAGRVPPALEPQMERIRSASLQMEQTVDLLLSLAREPDACQGRDDVRPARLVERAVLDSAPLLAGKAVEVVVDVPANWTVRAHAPAATTVIRNLIANACQHTRHGTVTIRREGDRLMVADTGPGFPAGLGSRVFDRHVKSGDSPGFGLGLSIVHRLCLAHGMELAVDTAPDRGTAVWIGFPTA